VAFERAHSESCVTSLCNKKTAMTLLRTSLRPHGKRWYAVWSMDRAVAYLRVSTQRQQRSGLGIEAQRAAIERFAASEGLTIISEYVEAETGKGADALDRRPQLAAALAAAKIERIRPKRQALRYLLGLMILFVAAGVVLVHAWPLIVSNLGSINIKSGGAPSAISVRVIDGDTISLNDGRPDVRLVGFNAPETGSRARCDAERAKGEAAKSRLRELVSKGAIGFQQVACSCPTGTKGRMTAISDGAVARSRPMVGM
jgi:endonuclease YncB( thermonuclease family)